jgi:hypothetical protein
MSTRARQIVVDVFDTFVESEPDSATALLIKVRDVILYQLEKETIEQPAPFETRGEQTFSPDELLTFDDEKNDQLNLDALEGEIEEHVREMVELDGPDDQDGITSIT